MRNVTPQHGLLTFEEFLEFESRSDVRHEFVAGSLCAMAGATERHNIIAMNIGALLWNATDGVTFRVCGSDMLVKVSDVVAYYPNVTVTCDPDDTEPLFKTRPCLVVEVISPSTSLTHVREKLLEYQRIETLR